MNNTLIKLVRDMSDEELDLYLKSLTLYRTTTCYLCGSKNSNYVINIQNKKLKEQKKLCSLCSDCYNKFLKELNIRDIEWEGKI